MDNLLLFKLVEEIRQQCRFAQFAFQNIRVTLQANDAEKVFFYVSAFLAHAAAVTRFFWPDRAESAPRGEQLRAACQLTDGALTRMRDFRGQLDQPDERLEDWATGLENRNYVDLNVMPQGTLSGFKADNFHRSLDPENFKLHLRGEGLDLRAVADELRRLDATCQSWLKTHHPW